MSVYYYPLKEEFGRANNICTFSRPVSTGPDRTLTLFSFFLLFAQRRSVYCKEHYAELLTTGGGKGAPRKRKGKGKAADTVRARLGIGGWQCGKGRGYLQQSWGGGVRGATL